MVDSSTLLPHQDMMDAFPLFKSTPESNVTQDGFTIDQQDIDQIRKDISIRTVQKSKISKQNHMAELSAQRLPLNHAAKCDICSALLSGQRDYESHIKGKKHRVALADVLNKNPQYKQPTYEELCLQKQELLVANKDSKKAENPSSEEKSDLSALATGVFICHLCNVICNSQLMFDDHISGKKHHAKVRLQSQTETAPPRLVPDNNPSSSNYCDVCSVQLTSETKLTEHLAQKRHQQRVKEEEHCASEAAAMNINFNDYEIPPTNEKKHLFLYECTTCNKKFGSKIQLIGHLKSALHAQLSNPSRSKSSSQNSNRKRNPQPIHNAPAINHPKPPPFRGSKKPAEKSRPPYGRQRPSFDRNFNESIPNNIFGAFDPSNQYSDKRSIQSVENSNQYHTPYPKRARTYNNGGNNSQYSYPTYADEYSAPAATQYSSNSQSYSSEMSNYNNSPLISHPPIQYSSNSYYDQPQNSYATSNYVNPINYSSDQPPLPNYEPSLSSTTYSTSSSAIYPSSLSKSYPPLPSTSYPPLPPSTSYPPQPPSISYPPTPSYDYYAKYPASLGAARNQGNNNYTQSSSNY